MQTYVDLQDTEEIHEIEVQVSLGQCVFCSRQKTVLREIRYEKPPQPRDTYKHYPQEEQESDI